MRVLLDKKQNIKYSGYRTLYWTLVLSVIVLIGGIAMDIFFLQRMEMYHNWGVIWLVDEGLPNTLYMLDVMVVLYLWQPSETFREYAFSQQLGGYDDVNGCELDDDRGLGEIELGQMGGVSMPDTPSATPRGPSATKIGGQLSPPPQYLE